MKNLIGITTTVALAFLFNSTSQAQTRPNIKQQETIETQASAGCSYRIRERNGICSFIFLPAEKPYLLIRKLTPHLN